MVKRQKDKQYQSAREHRANQSLRAGARLSTAARPLPFDCCALTLTPYATPACTPGGVLFDTASLVPHVLAHGVDPVTGAAMTSRDVVALCMDRDDATGHWQCPVLNKPFTNRSKVVAIRQRPPGNEANVFSYEAYHELNVKAKNNTDLISGKKFSKEDVIVLQDPDDKELCRLRDIQNFHHIQLQRQENSQQQQNAGTSANVTHSVTASRIMDKLDRNKRKRAAEDQAKKLLKANRDPVNATVTADDTPPPPAGTATGTTQIYTDELINAVNLTSGKASGSLTSTTMTVTRENKARAATDEEIIASQCEQLKRLKKKGMVRMFTNNGAMDLEIHCDIVPRAAMNFLLLAEKREYDGSKFHRSIPNFMIQGGKPPGCKGRDSGNSAWGKPFADEFDDRLTHTGRGVVAMANSGPGTNGRQFYVTYASCAHLNRKHTIFGNVVGGMEVLRKLEQVPTDRDTDRPLDAILIEGLEILENPVAEALEAEGERVRRRKEEKCGATRAQRTSAVAGKGDGAVPGIPPGPRARNALAKGSDPPPVAIGKYLNATRKKVKKRSRNLGNGNGVHDVTAAATASRLPPPPKKTTFGDFSGW